MIVMLFLFVLKYEDQLYHVFRDLVHNAFIFGIRDKNDLIVLPLEQQKLLEEHFFSPLELYSISKQRIAAMGLILSISFTFVSPHVQAKSPYTNATNFTNSMQIIRLRTNSVPETTTSVNLNTDITQFKQYNPEIVTNFYQAVMQNPNLKEDEKAFFLQYIPFLDDYQYCLNLDNIYQVFAHFEGINNYDKESTTLGRCTDNSDYDYNNNQMAYKIRIDMYTPKEDQEHYYKVLKHEGFHLIQSGTPYGQLGQIVSYKDGKYYNEAEVKRLKGTNSTYPGGQNILMGNIRQSKNEFIKEGLAELLALEYHNNTAPCYSRQQTMVKLLIRILGKNTMIRCMGKDGMVILYNELSQLGLSHEEIFKLITLGNMSLTSSSKENDALCSYQMAELFYKAYVLKFGETFENNINDAILFRNLTIEHSTDTECIEHIETQIKNGNLKLQYSELWQMVKADEYLHNFFPKEYFEGKVIVSASSEKCYLNKSKMKNNYIYRITISYLDQRNNKYYTDEFLENEFIQKRQK